MLIELMEYTNEVFETIITKCNKLLVAENSLCLTAWDTTSFSITSASIASSDKIENSKNVVEIKDDLSDSEYRKILKEERIYKLIKYDLFDSTKEADIKYYLHK